MVKYLVKHKMKNPVVKKDKRAMIYAGTIAAGVGTYFVYKAIKNRKMCCNELDCCCEEYDDDEYIDDEYNYYDDGDETDELEMKVDEFNANRIVPQNCTNVSKEKLESYVNKAEEERDYKEREENKLRDNTEIN